MTLKLSDEQRQALADHPSEPLVVEDAQTRTRYVLLRLDAYQQLQLQLSDDSEPDPREFYPAFTQAIKEDLDAPGMEDYDDYEAHRKQP
jgi:hypothetical protein